MNAQPETVLLPVADIEMGDRLRLVDDDYAELLAASMEDRGLMQPIEVGKANRKGAYQLIAGAHRLTAARLLGWNEIPAIVHAADKIEAQLREIDENLMRRELTPLDRATFLARRKELYEAKYPQAKHGGDRKSDQVAKFGHLIERFTAEVSDKLDISERSLRRAIARYTAISPRVRERIATTWIARKGAVLDALARETNEDQWLIVTEMLAEKDPARSVAEAIERVRGPSINEVISEDERQYRVLMNGWRKASQRVRDRFVEAINGQADASGSMDEAA